MTSIIPNPETWKKVCTKCEVLKPLKEYHKDRRKQDGRKSWCRSCVHLYDRSFSNHNRNTESNKIRKRARQMAYRRLARLEPDKFWMLFRQELYKAGLSEGDIEKVIKDSESGDKRVTAQ